MDHVLALAAGQSERNQGQSPPNAAYMATIWQFLPDRERILGLGLNEYAGHETADLRGFLLAEGAENRTRQSLDHKPELYQLSYCHRDSPQFSLRGRWLAPSRGAGKRSG
jgi:hypothetical protein